MAFEARSSCFEADICYYRFPEFILSMELTPPSSSRAKRQLNETERIGRSTDRPPPQCPVVAEGVQWELHAGCRAFRHAFSRGCMMDSGGPISVILAVRPPERYECEPTGNPMLRGELTQIDR
jgi:hypothetical protein